MITFPEHKASLSLTHNEHLASYEELGNLVAGGKYADAYYADDAWVSPEQKRKAIETNDCWILHWYPNSPVSFHHLIAADLDVLLDHANRR